MHTFWISLSDGTQKPGAQFIGVVVLKADDPHSALKAALSIVERDRGGISKDGEAELFIIDDNQVPPHLMDRALSREETIEAGGEAVTVVQCGNCGHRSVEH